MRVRRFTRKARSPAAPGSSTVQLHGVSAPLLVKRVGRARRMRLRVDVRAGAPVLVLPLRVSLDRGLAFAADHVDWLRAHLALLPPQVGFAPGNMIPLEGEPHQLRANSAGAIGVSVEHDGEARTIRVSGPPQRFARTLLDWLKRRARARLVASAEAAATRIERRVQHISLRDPRSRWGSCSRHGALSFSWRLILAPPFVLDYVVAHEVAHLAQMNHSPTFWRMVERLSPHRALAQQWLARQGGELHRFG